MGFAVLAHTGDADAELLARELARRAGGPSVALVRAEELLLGSKFTHCLDGDGVVTEIALASGQELDSRTLDGVVCRLSHAPVPQFAGAPEADRRYAAMEAYALLLSWLASLECPLLNPPSPGGLGGSSPGLAELLPLAAACGLRGRRFQFDSAGAAPQQPDWPAFEVDLIAGSTSSLAPANGAGPERHPRLWLEPLGQAPVEVLVVGDRVLGPVGDAEATACTELARRLGCPLLGVHLAEPAGRDRGEMLFCGVETMPRLGRESTAAVADLLLGDAA